jgi:hypothetical protein
VPSKGRRFPGTSSLPNIIAWVSQGQCFSVFGALKAAQLKAAQVIGDWFYGHF